MKSVRKETDIQTERQREIVCVSNSERGGVWRPDVVDVGTAVVGAAGDVAPAWTEGHPNRLPGSMAIKSAHTAA